MDSSNNQNLSPIKSYVYATDEFENSVNPMKQYMFRSDEFENSTNLNVSEKKFQMTFSPNHDLHE